ncbi:MAG: Rossmann-like and DUF2520 domain-containing protein [Pyrinomonadaceae bacterium]
MKGRAGKKISRALSTTGLPVSPSHPFVAIVGAGRLGGALARALDSAGYRITALVARRPARARQVARLCPNSTPLALAASQLERLPAHTDLLLIATPDAQLAETASRLAASLTAQAAAGPQQQQHQGTKRKPPGRRVALHASGALPSGVLDPLRALNFAVGSLHPLASVSDAESGAENLRGAYYCVEGDEAARRAARRIVRALGGHSFGISPDDKALYHAVAVMTAGHVVALFDLASELLARCGLTGDQSRAALLPLLSSAVANLRHASSPAHALTGTFARADAGTVRRHLVALREQNAPTALAVYTLLGRRSLELARAAGADDEALNEIARLLEKKG